MIPHELSHMTTLRPAICEAKRSPLRRSNVATAFALSLALSLGAAAAPVAQTESPNLTGNWQLSCTGRKGQTRQAALQIQQDGSKLSGTISVGSGRSGALNGTIQGTQVSFSAPGGKLTFTGTVNGNTMTGQSQKGRSCSVIRQ
jgi:invasion protein IalB